MQRFEFQTFGVAANMSNQMIGLYKLRLQPRKYVRRVVIGVPTSPTQNFDGGNHASSHGLFAR